jgi:hypothetical protein
MFTDKKRYEELKKSILQKSGRLPLKALDLVDHLVGILDGNFSTYRFSLSSSAWVEALGQMGWRGGGDAPGGSSFSSALRRRIVDSPRPR